MLSGNQGCKALLLFELDQPLERTCRSEEGRFSILPTASYVFRCGLAIAKDIGF